MFRTLRPAPRTLWIVSSMLVLGSPVPGRQIVSNMDAVDTLTPPAEREAAGDGLQPSHGPGLEASERSLQGLTAGWPVDLGSNVAGYPYTPTLANVTGDAALEVFVVGENCFGLRGDGTFLPGWPTVEQTYQGYATNGNFPGPSVADIDRDGSREILWSTRDWYAGNSRIWSFNAKNTDGTNQPGYPQEAPDQQSNAMNSPLVVGDINGDGNLEAWSAHTLGNTGDYQRLTALDHLGARLFTRDFGPTELIHAPYYGDVDGDGTKEIFAVTFRNSVPPGFRLHVLYPDGTEKPGFPISLGQVSTGWLTEGVPVPADLDGDGDLEFFVAFYTTSASFVRCVHHDGTLLAGFPLQVTTQSQIFYLGLGDLTGDGHPELLVTDKRIAVGGEYRLWAFDLHNGNALLPGWPCILTAWPKGIPIVVDVDNEGRKDVVLALESGEVVAFSVAAQMLPGFPKTMAAASYSGVAAGDIDGDGLFELVAASTDGWVYAWDTAGEALPGRADWPMRGVNAQNHGVYGVVEDPTGIPSIEWAGGLPSRLVGAPNPFAVGTAIRFTLPRDASTVLRVFDPSGRVVRTLEAGALSAGQHTLAWDGCGPDGRRLPAGSYQLSLESGNAVARGRVVVIR